MSSIAEWISCGLSYNTAIQKEQITTDVTQEKKQTLKKYDELKSTKEHVKLVKLNHGDRARPVLPWVCGGVRY